MKDTVKEKMEKRLERLNEQFDNAIAEGNEKAANLLERKITQVEDDIETEGITEAQTKRKAKEEVKDLGNEDEDVCPDCGGDLLDYGDNTLVCERCHEEYYIE